MRTAVFVEEHYESMKRDVPPKHRGYPYVLKDGLADEGETYDLVPGHEVITPAEGFTGNPAKADMQSAMLFLHPDSEIRLTGRPTGRFEG